jgi:hypothetical protein
MSIFSPGVPARPLDNREPFDPKGAIGVDIRIFRINCDFRPQTRITATPFTITTVGYCRHLSFKSLTRTEDSSGKDT